MKSMKHRERVLAALNRQETDRCPIDFGGSTVTTLTDGAYKNLKRYLGVTSDTVYMKKKSRIVSVDEQILVKYDIDTRHLLPGRPFGWEDIFQPDGSYTDEWNVTWRKAPDGHYAVDKSPLKESEISDLECHPWPVIDDTGRTKGLRSKAQELHIGTEYAIVFSLPSALIHQCQYLRGFTEFLIDLYCNQKFAEALMDKVEEIWMGMAVRQLEEIAGFVDVVVVSDDVAFQDNCYVRPELYRQLIKPRHKRMIEKIKEISEAKVMYHSCGAVLPIMEDFIEIGIDALNPIQVKAKGMDPALLKEKYASLLTFWGGVDTQYLLPYGSPEEVQANVKEMVEILGKGGGYILASVHNIQDDVKPENIHAMLNAVKI